MIEAWFERVRNDGVLFAEQRLEQAAIGVEAGAVEDRVLHAEKAGNARLQLLVLLLRAADEADRRHAVAIAVERPLGRIAKLLAVGEAEIIVGAEVEQFLARHLDLGRLRRTDHALRLVQAGGFQALKFRRQMGKERVAHWLNAPEFKDRQTVARHGTKIHDKSDVKAGAKRSAAARPSHPQVRQWQFRTGIRRRYRCRCARRTERALRKPRDPVPLQAAFLRYRQARRSRGSFFPDRRPR